MKKVFDLQAIILLLFAFLGCDKPKNNQHLINQTTGCGNIFVARVMEEDKILSIWIDQEKTTFSIDFQTFENVANENFVTVKMEQNCEIDKVWYSQCNDVAGNSKCVSVFWSLTKGNLSYKVSKVLDFYDCFSNELYEVTVILENAEFKKDNSTETLTTFDRVEFNNVQVGWCAG